MKLFLKIFLWFLAALALMVGVIIFITRTFQTQPMVNYFERSTRNQLMVYSETATQIVKGETEEGLRIYLERLSALKPTRQINLIAPDDTIWFGERIDDPGALAIARRTLASDAVETDFSGEEKIYGAGPVNFPDGRRFAMIFQWENQSPPSLFWGSTTAYWRLAGILLTSLILCYLLALYLTNPIRKLRGATQKLADGDLQARVADQIGRRHDELSDLARDFDNMAERIESLITSQQRLSRDISHELRSPLARLNVALEIAKQKSNLDSLPMLERIETESVRLNEMISRLLTLARLESGADGPERLRMDLAELVRDVAADAKFEAEANGKFVELSSADSCMVMGNENLLRSAIENVLRNAVKYTADRTVVDVSLVKQNGHAIVAVSDRGGGVPADELANLFRPFYRVGEDRTRKTGGSGLGLAIAERAVKAHKGSITAKNVTGGLRIEIVFDVTDQSKN